ncbi:MAG: glucose 1-dehydrogenase [Chloroflexi bacterium]|nr:glucose 1-dehydrogenase [Chloroflexota bacterium]
MDNRHSFLHKIALITGAGSGIGRATALAFAAGGAAVVVADVNEAGGQETVELARQAGRDAIFIGADVSRSDEVEALVGETVRRFGRLDIAVNNAGIGGAWARTADYPLADWERVLAVNLSGVFYCMQQEIRQMLAQGGGAIVNVASIAGQRALANAPAYTASKHGVIGLTRTAAQEYARQNIRVNAVCPVFTRTPLFQGMIEGNARLEERLLHNIPVRRFGEPQEIAGAILWLCSDGATFVTGQAVNVDGGLTA